MAAFTAERVVVFGAGALGSAIGAKLSRRLPVTLVGRPRHVRAIRERGLRVSGFDDFVADVDAAESLPEVTPGTLALVTVKLFDLDAAADALAAALPAEGCLVLPVMNGLHPERRLRERLGPGRPVVRGVAMFGATLEGPGHVSYWGGGVKLGPSEHSGRLADSFASAGIECEVAGDFDELVWRKFAVNCIWNPLTAVLGVRNSRLVTPELDLLRRRVAEECAAVARAEGVTLAGDFAETTDRALEQSNNRSSMLQDITRRARTENEYLSGELVRLAEAHGIAAPASALLRDLVAAIEEMPVAARPASLDTAAARP